MGGKNTDEELRERIRGWLEHYRDRYVAAGMTQKDLADKIGIAPSSVSQYINRVRTVGLDTLAKIHRGLHVSADQLLDNDPPPKPDPGAAPRRTPAPKRPRRTERAELRPRQIRE